MSGDWNTIESDASVFTHLVEKLGVKDVQFDELIELDAESLKQLSPVYGVIFLFKYVTDAGPNATPANGSFDPDAAERLFFATQRIQNACGTQAVLSVLLNQEGQVDIGPHLRLFKEFTSAFPFDVFNVYARKTMDFELTRTIQLRGEALSNSELIRDVHNSFARSSPFVNEAQRLATENDDVYHFIAYSSINGTLYELDGLQPAPISHGICEFDEFPTKIIPVLQQRINRYPLNEIRFNLMAMIKDPRPHAREIGDHLRLEREEQKRKMWQWENSLRRHNFIGFIAEMLKGVTSSKLQQGDDAYDEWLREAKAKAEARVQESVGTKDKDK